MYGELRAAEEIVILSDCRNEGQGKIEPEKYYIDLHQPLTSGGNAVDWYGRYDRRQRQ